MREAPSHSCLTPGGTLQRMDRLRRVTLTPVLVLTIVTSLAHVVMAHSAHPPDVISAPAATAHHQQHAFPAAVQDTGLVGVELVQHESETCPSPTWVTNRADALGGAEPRSTAAPDLLPHRAGLAEASPPAGDPPRLDGPDRQALTQVFRL